MELQTQIDELKTSSKRQKFVIIALACLVVFFAVKPHGVITCDGWRVVDKDGNLRISATTYADGEASVQWFDKDGKVRIDAATNADGEAGVIWFDKDGKVRIDAGTNADGQAGVIWRDKDEKMRIVAATDANGTVVLPTSDKK